MSRRHPALLVVLALAITFTAAAQTQPETQTSPGAQQQPRAQTGAQQRAGQPPAMQQDGNVNRLYMLTPLPGHSAQLEQGLRRHMQFHQQQGDTFRYFVWSVETGPQMGNLVVGTFGHRWADFDEQEKRLGEKDAADIQANIAPHVERVGSSFWMFRSDLSGPPDTGQPSRFLSVTELVVQPTRMRDLEGIIRQVGQGYRKFQPQPQTRGGWYQLLNGGEPAPGPVLALVQQRDDWADFSPQGMTPMQVLQKALGEAKGQATWRTAQESVQSLHTFVMRYRPDLSSAPTTR